jgi:hypothetical protein
MALLFKNQSQPDCAPLVYLGRDGPNFPCDAWAAGCVELLIAGGLRLLSLSERTHARPSAPVGLPLISSRLLFKNDTLRGASQLLTSRW